jgi:hypothetical protein
VTFRKGSVLLKNRGRSGKTRGSSERTSAQRTELEGSPNSEQQQKHSGRGRGAATTMDTRAGQVKLEAGA